MDNDKKVGFPKPKKPKKRKITLPKVKDTIDPIPEIPPLKGIPEIKDLPKLD